MKKLLLLLTLIYCGISAKAQWVNQPTGQAGNSTVLSISPVNNNVVWAVTSDNEVLRSINGGTTWTIIPVAATTGFTMPSVNCITAIDASTAWITVVELGILTTGVFKTTDGGQTWSRQTSAYSPDSWGNMIHFFNANDGITMGDTNGGYFEIYTTNNGGNSWNRVPLSDLPAPTLNDDIGTGGDLYSVSGNTIWIGVLGMRVLKSNDKGLHWTVANTGLTPSSSNTLPYGLALTDTNNGLVLANAQLRRTTDGGQNWTAVNYNGPVRFYLSNVPSAPNTYISTGRNSTIGSSYSNDGGNTWINLENSISHGLPRFSGPTTGWSGGVNTLYKFNSAILGNKGSSETHSFLISPNPGIGLFNITPTSTKPFTLEVYDLVGNKVEQQAGISFGKNTVDLAGQKKGIYLLHILSGEQRIIEKLVLQ